ncbi:MAG: hypothetical protein C5B59_10880 [Bacteroidetes bacterium]|nr:MAG: hypothetical protein C5B59_10880 [Bacteroidota bacterium]
MEVHSSKPDKLNKPNNIWCLAQIWKFKNIAFVLVFFIFLFLSNIRCKKNIDTFKKDYPTITSVRPPSARQGDTIVIVGSNFNPDPSLDTVKLNGIPAHIVKATTDSLFVIVPAGNCSGVVTVNGNAFDGPGFTLIKAAVITITGISPVSAKPGDTVIITGSNFNLNPSLDTVRFNGVLAHVEKAEKDTLFVIVPHATNGVVTVNGVPALGPAFTIVDIFPPEDIYARIVEYPNYNPIPEALVRLYYSIPDTLIYGGITAKGSVIDSAYSDQNGAVYFSRLDSMAKVYGTKTFDLTATKSNYWPQNVDDGILLGSHKVDSSTILLFSVAWIKVHIKDTASKPAYPHLAIYFDISAGGLPGPNSVVYPYNSADHLKVFNFNGDTVLLYKSCGSCPNQIAIFTGDNETSLPVPWVWGSSNTANKSDTANWEILLQP